MNGAEKGINQMWKQECAEEKENEKVGEKENRANSKY